MLACDTLRPTADQLFMPLGSNSSNTNKGIVVGGKGRYLTGMDVTLVAVPKQGYVFDKWRNDGNRDNPRHVMMNYQNSETLFVADFIDDGTTGISDPLKDAGITITVQQGMLVVSGAVGRSIRLYDALGRQLAYLPALPPSGITNPLCIPLPATGVYLLHVEGLPARKVTYIR